MKPTEPLYRFYEAEVSTCRLFWQLWQVWLVFRLRRHRPSPCAIAVKAAELSFGSNAASSVAAAAERPFLAILATSVGFPASPAPDCPSSFSGAIGAKSFQLSVGWCSTSIL
jgi:hypothetical protein